MLPFLLFLCALTGVASSEVTSPPPSPPPSSSMTLETWEIALITGCGTLALLMCAYSVYILMRLRRTPPKPLTRVIVEVEEGRGKKDSKPPAKKESKTVEKTDAKPTATKDSRTVDKKQTKPAEKKQTKPAEKKDVTTAASKPSAKDDTGAGVIAVKIQPNNHAVTCPGGGKACIGARKEGVQTIPQPNQYPPSRPRRGSAPSRITGGRSSAPRV